MPHNELPAPTDPEAHRLVIDAVDEYMSIGDLLLGGELTTETIQRFPWLTDAKVDNVLVDRFTGLADGIRDFRNQHARDPNAPISIERSIIDDVIHFKEVVLDLLRYAESWPRPLTNEERLGRGRAHNACKEIKEVLERAEESRALSQPTAGQGREVGKSNKQQKRGPKKKYDEKLDDRRFQDYQVSGLKLKEFCDARGLNYKDMQKLVNRVGKRLRRDPE